MARKKYMLGTFGPFFYDDERQYPGETFNYGAIRIFSPATSDKNALLVSGSDGVFRPLAGMPVYSAGAEGILSNTGADMATDLTDLSSYINSVGGGVLQLDNGTYLVDNNGLVLYDNVHLTGKGWQTTLAAYTSTINSYLISIHPGTTAVSDPEQFDNIISNIRLNGQLDVFKYHEFTHLVNVNGAADVLLWHVFFYNWRGDAVYFGSTNTAGEEAHNNRLFVAFSKFDGNVSAANRLLTPVAGTTLNNRNGISFIDGKMAAVIYSHFTNLGAGTNPGAIDIEPDEQSFHIVQDIFLKGLVIEDVTRDGIQIRLPLTTLSTVPINFVLEDIRVSQNTNSTVAGHDNGFILMKLNPSRRPSVDDPYLNIKVRNFSTYGVRKPFTLLGVRGVDIEGGHHKNAEQSAIVGYLDAVSQSVLDVCIKGVTFEDCGDVSGYVLGSWDFNGLELYENRIIGGPSIGWYFRSASAFTSAHTNLVVDKNKYRKGNGSLAAVLSFESTSLRDYDTENYGQDYFFDFATTPTHALEGAGYVDVELTGSTINWNTYRTNQPISTWRINNASGGSLTFQYITNVPAGHILHLWLSASAANVLTVQHDVLTTGGEIRLNGSVDFLVDDAAHGLTLFAREDPVSGNVFLQEISRMDQGQLRNVDDYVMIGNQQVVGARTTAIGSLLDSTGGATSATLNATGNATTDANFASLVLKYNKLLDVIGLPSTAGHGLTSD